MDNDELEKVVAGLVDFAVETWPEDGVSERATAEEELVNG